MQDSHLLYSDNKSLAFIIFYALAWRTGGVALEYLAVDISLVEVVPFVLVICLPKEQAQMVQLLLLEIHS